MAASTDPMVEVDPRTWIARLRTDRVAIFRASASKTSNAAAEETSAVTVLVAEATALAVAVIASVEEDLEASVAVAALAGSVVAGADDKN